MPRKKIVAIVGCLLLFTAFDGLLAQDTPKHPPTANLESQSSQTSGSFAIVIHGGAGGDPSRWSQEYRRQRQDGLRAALNAGTELLESGGKALDVVERVVRLLEDDETFNAGRGCVLNEVGEHELDASIMDGQTLQCGAVASVRRTKNPITLARKVMTETRHILLIGSGADEFAESLGLETAAPEYFRTERQLQSWKSWKDHQSDISSTLDRQSYFGTVGCVVVDRHGNLAAATSTGGLMGKRWGRVGDSPIIGAGNYADNQTCAVSGTGVGEEFIRHNIASDVAARMRYAGNDLKLAASKAVANLPDHCGGIIAVDRQGNIAIEFNTSAMSRAFANSRGEQGIYLAREDTNSSP